MNRFSLRENKLLLLLGFNLALLVISAPRFSESRDTVISYLLFLLMSLGLGLVWYKSKRAAKRHQGRMTGSARIMIKLRRNKTALFGLIVISVVAYLAVLAPFCVPQDPNAIDWSALAAKPSAKHWMGTDELGRDLMSRVIYGMRVALGLGLMAVILNSITGTVLGLLAGYYGGKVDTVIMRILEVWNSIPFILLVIA
ncbi:MAG: ABC transporter permease, partial [Candidatus Thiodiazotropha taylori]|nr:ABC transporter permease [Candidatus Thiodiazotropha taylori]MCW4292476.1 ABC transporter permease [Candidatus Thiodiazotropha taylori]